MALSTLSLSACGDTAGPEQGADVESVQEEADDTDSYDGPYDGGFYEDVNGYAGKIVTVSADVNRKLGPTSFTIAGTDDTTVEELLIVGADSSTQITEDLTVKVTGTVKTDFDLITFEKDMGVDLDDEVAEPLLLKEKSTWASLIVGFAIAWWEWLSPARSAYWSSRAAQSPSRRTAQPLPQPRRLPPPRLPTRLRVRAPARRTFLG